MTTTIKTIQKLMRNRNMSKLEYIAGRDRITFLNLSDNWLSNYFKLIGVRATPDFIGISISLEDARKFLFPIPQRGSTVRLYCDARRKPEIM